MSKKNNKIITSVERYKPKKENGLTNEQVNERIENKLVNDTKIKTSNSIVKIFLKNIFTFFNMIWLVIAIALLSVRSYGDLMFVFVVIANTAISIIQEIRAKITVDKLSLVTAPKIKVVRNNEIHEVKSENLVLDDIIILENGNQIPADSIIIDGLVETNESMLTGESNSIKKQVGDMLLAGSFLTSGYCYAKVERVGKDNYIQSVAEQAKDFKAPTSNLCKDLNKLIKYIAIMLIPIGILTFLKESIFVGGNFTTAVISTSGALTGMIPAGMYLLVTIGLSVGVIKLSKRKTIVKDIYSIEMLARANVICLDKTGTLTDGTMNVVEVVSQNGEKLNKIEKVMGSILQNQKSVNATSLALIKKFGKNFEFEVSDVVEFSSSRKYSVTTFKNKKNYYIGAPAFIKCKVSKEQQKLCTQYMEQGYRVIALVEDSNPYDEKTAGKNGTIIAFFVLEDHIRKDAIETIQWFKDNNVDIKIISGDDPITVSKIAKRVGVDNADKFISLENLSLHEVAQVATQFTVFGRVTPEQKQVIVKSLKMKGMVVAMTGDGVNDTLALKEADCSIAMADGSEAARNISKLVLMDSNFTAIPSIVKEGRQVINNVQKSSVLYLMKTLFTIMLCLTTLLLNTSYPFAPRQTLLLEMFVIGLPSFILTFVPNNNIIVGNFIPQVLKRSIPRAFLMFVYVLVIIILNSTFDVLSPTEYTTLSTMVLTFIGYINLFWLCIPFTWITGSAAILSLLCLIAGLIGFADMFYLTDFSFVVWLIFISLMVWGMIIHFCSRFALNNITKKIKERKLKNNNNQN